MSMLHELCLLIIMLTHPSWEIRVYYNTNNGTIAPVVARTTTRSQNVHRKPPPVWEKQEDDTPDPHPFVYVLPTHLTSNKDWFDPRFNNKIYGPQIKTPPPLAAYHGSKNVYWTWTQSLGAIASNKETNAGIINPPIAKYTQKIWPSNASKGSIINAKSKGHKTHNNIIYTT